MSTDVSGCCRKSNDIGPSSAEISAESAIRRLKLLMRHILNAAYIEPAKRVLSQRGGTHVSQPQQDWAGVCRSPPSDYAG